MLTCAASSSSGLSGRTCLWSPPNRTLESSFKGLSKLSQQMSYYPPHGTGTTYPYGTYQHPQAYTGVQAPGGYATTPYQTPYPHTAGYGAAWPYAYPYYNPPNHAQQPQATAARPTTLHTPTAATTSTTAITTTTTMTPSMPAPVPQPIPPPVSQTPRSANITSYTLQQARETVAAAAAAAAASPVTATGSTMSVLPIHRNVRKQGQHRGLFTKECTWLDF